MPSYKLIYFDFRGFAEPARQLFHLAGVPFEDQRLSMEDDSWEKIKDFTPFRQLPILCVDDFLIPQSPSICRYLAGKFGYAGKTPEEKAWVDAIVDQFKDFVHEIYPMIPAMRGLKSPEEYKKIKEEVFIPGKNKFFGILNGILDKSESGFLVGEGLTWADLVVCDYLVTLEKSELFDGKDEPKLVALREKVYSEEKLNKWISTRPDTQF